MLDKSRMPLYKETIQKIIDLLIENKLTHLEIDTVLFITLNAHFEESNLTKEDVAIVREQITSILRLTKR